MLNAETPPDPGDAGGGPSHHLRVAAGLSGLLLIGAAVAVWLWLDRTPPASASDEDEDLDQVLAVVNPGYVGIKVCAECHADRAAEFATTRHYLACTTQSGVAAPGFTPERGRF